MPLPNLNQGGNQSPAQSPPGANPNNRPRQVENSPGVFKTWANNMATTVSENISPSNFIRQGTYNAFGNNAVTRTAMGFMDHSLDALTSFLSGKKKDEEPESKIEKLIKEQIKIATESEDILKELLSAIKEGYGKLEGKKHIDESELHDLNDKQEQKIPEDQDKLKQRSPIYALLENISSDVIEIKHILTNGFEKIYETFDDNGRTKRKHINDDVEDAVIIKETQYSKSRDLVINRHFVNIEKILKAISVDADKTVALLSEKPLSTAEQDVEGRKPKFMGQVDEVGPTGLQGPSKEEAEKKGNGFIGLISAAIGFLIENIVGGIKKLALKTIELFTKGIEELTSAIMKAWEFLKAGAKAIYEFGQKAVGSAIDFGKGVIKKGGEIAEKVGTKAVEIGKDAIGLAKKGGKFLLEGAEKGAKFIPGLGEIVMAGDALYNGYEGAKNAKDLLDIKEDRDATWQEKTAGAVGSIADSFSFGMLDEKSTAKWVNNLISTKNDNREKLAQTHKDTAAQAAIPAAAAAGSPVVVNNENNSYYSGRKNNRNEDDSLRRYLDKHYAF